MRVVIAPDSFKGSVSAATATEALIRGWRQVDQQAELLPYPMADGGEGTLAAFAVAFPDSVHVPVRVTGPDGAERDTHWLQLPDQHTAVVELALTSGIELLTTLRPLDADTLGCGQAIAAAVDAGMTRIIVGIGSSASTDGGTGLLRGLGAQFLDASGRPTPPGATGLSCINTIDLHRLRSPVTTLVITDVTNPLTGPAGATYTFGPQKGLTTPDLPRIDAEMARYAHLLEAELGRGSFCESEGAGAAGGAGFGLLAWGATLVPGAEEIARLTGAADAISGADLVITGEGFFDRGSAAGKVPHFISGLHSSVALVAGGIASDAPTDMFVEAVSLTEEAGSTVAALAQPEHFLELAGRKLATQLRK